MTGPEALAHAAAQGEWGRHVPHVVERIESLPRDELRGAELGVGWGYSAAAILACIPRVRKHAMVDTWWPWWPDHPYATSGDAGGRVGVDLAERMRLEALAVTEFAGPRRSVLRMTTAEAALRVPDRSLDYIFIDGDHTLGGVHYDLVAWWPKLRSGGLCLGHDWGRWGVKDAATIFMQGHGLAIELGPETLWWSYAP